LAGETGTDDEAIGSGQIQAHLPRSAADLDDARVAGNGTVQAPREVAALGPRSQPRQIVAWRVAGERRLLVETAHGVDARLAPKAQVRNPVLGLIPRAALRARPVGPEQSTACRASEQIVEETDHQIEEMN